LAQNQYFWHNINQLHGHRSNIHGPGKEAPRALLTGLAMVAPVEVGKGGIEPPQQIKSMS
jgi:hypothetical protein|tara:strand:- start:547 stop:726 length:180 start_codon:yes stop_codon:yes gene_type:complete